jgi:hypothetical protein
MTHQNQRRVLIQHILNRRQRGADAFVVGHFAIRHRHVEIHAHQHAFVFEVNVSYGFFVHGASPVN